MWMRGLGVVGREGERDVVVWLMIMSCSSKFCLLLLTLMLCLSSNAAGVVFRPACLAVSSFATQPGYRSQLR